MANRPAARRTNHPTAVPPGRRPEREASVPRPTLTTQRVVLLATLAVVTMWAYAGVSRNGWVFYDDPHYVYENPHVNHGLQLRNALWFLGHSHSDNWHPLTSWSHMLDVQLFGLSPKGPHVVNLALHAVNAVLLVMVLFRLTGAWWKSLVVGALFALHPLRVESVAWISERKDVLSGLLFLVALDVYRRWAAHPSGRRMALLLATYALGLIAKPMLVTLPVVLVLLDIWPLRRLEGSAAAASRPVRHGAAPARSLAGLIGEKWPLIVLAVTSAVVTFFVQRQSGAMATIEAVSFTRRFTNAMLSYWWYVGKTFWPDRLAPFYPMSQHAAWTWMLATIGVVLASLLTLGQARRRPYLAVGWTWYAAMLLPVIGLVQVGAQSHADRYTYLPTIGLAIALVWGTAELVGRTRSLQFGAIAACLLAVAALAVATTRQVALWRNTGILFTHALAVTPDNAIARQQIGNAYLHARNLPAAIEQYERALSLAPNSAETHNNLGVTLGALGRYDEAISHLQIAVRLKPDAEKHHNLGFAYANSGKLNEAIAEYEAALRLDPEDNLSLLHMADALTRLGRHAEADQIRARAHR